MKNFFIVGSSKCGTTSLHRYLGMHPSIAISDPKETKFFCEADGGKYENFFHFDKLTEIKGESTPQYFASEIVAERIKKYDPDSKVIILVRDPIRRAWSHYTYNVQMFAENRSFEEVARADYARFEKGDGYSKPGDAKYVDNIIALGMYSKFIPMWCKLFKHVLVLSYEEFFTDVGMNINLVFDFLGVSRIDVGRLEIYNKTKNVRYITLNRIITSKRLMWARRMFPRYIKSRVQNLMWDDARISPMSMKEWQLLQDIYRYELLAFKRGYRCS